VRRLFHLDVQGVPKERAALRAGMTPKTARKYRRLGKLPSEVQRMERDWRTRPDPFTAVWPELEALLEVNPGLEVKTLFAELQRRYPGRFADGQVRTLQRRGEEGGRLPRAGREGVFPLCAHPPRPCAPPAPPP